MPLAMGDLASRLGCLGEGRLHARAKTWAQGDPPHQRLLGLVGPRALKVTEVTQTVFMRLAVGPGHPAQLRQDSLGWSGGQVPAASVCPQGLAHPSQLAGGHGGAAGLAGPLAPDGTVAAAQLWEQEVQGVEGRPHGGPLGPRVLCALGQGPAQ